MRRRGEREGSASPTKDTHTHQADIKQKQNGWASANRGSAQTKARHPGKPRATNARRAGTSAQGWPPLPTAGPSTPPPHPLHTAGRARTFHSGAGQEQLHPPPPPPPTPTPTERQVPRRPRGAISRRSTQPHPTPPHSGQATSRQHQGRPPPTGEQHPTADEEHTAQRKARKGAAKGTDAHTTRQSQPPPPPSPPCRIEQNPQSV